MLHNNRLTEYTIAVRYNNFKENLQPDAPWRLHTNGETLPDDNDYISTYFANEGNNDDSDLLDLLYEEEDRKNFIEL